MPETNRKSKLNSLIERLFKNVVAQFIGPPPSSLRGAKAPKQSRGDMRLLRRALMALSARLAMTKSEMSDESVPDLIRDPKIGG
jgi:hypothetical protein